MASESRVQRVLDEPSAIIPVDITLGAGQQSPHYDALASVAEDNSEKMPDKTPIRVRIAHVNVDLVAMHRLQVLAFDEQDLLIGQPLTKATIQAAQAEALSAIPNSGHGSPQDLVVKQGAARDRVERGVLKQTAEVTADKFTSRGTKLQETLAEDVRLALDAIEFDVSEEDGLVSLRETVELPDLQKRASGYEEAMSKSDPLGFLLQQLDASIRLGKDLGNLRAICVKVANEFRSNPRARAVEARVNQGERWVKGPHELDDLTKATMLLKALEDYKQSQRPEYLKTAVELMDRLMQVFQALFAQNPAENLATAYYVDRPVASLSPAPTWDAIDPQWVRRFLRPSAFQLPGWSPVIARTASATSQGAPIRAAARRAR